MDVPPLVRPQSEFLPFHDPAISWATFESFFCDFLASGPILTIRADGQALQRKVISARPYGRRGDSQHGIDIVAEIQGGETWVFQCKHYRQWGPADTANAIDMCTFTATRKFLLVTRELSEACVTVAAQHPDWELWDSRRISQEFRLRVPREAGARILFAHFGPGWDQAFFGLRGDGPLLTADAKFAPFCQPNRRFHHRLPLVGRDAWLEQLDGFVRNAEARVFMFVGRGGLGKSRILVSWSEKFGANHRGALLRFVSDVPSDFSAALSAISDPAVLAFDDAHRLIEVRRALFPDLVRFPNWKLVLSLRPGAQNVVRRELVESGFDTRHVIEGPELRRLNDEETMNLVREALGPELVTQYDQFLYGVSRDCPLVAVLGAELLREGRVPAEVLTDGSAFRAHVFDSLQLIAEVAKFRPWKNVDVQITDLKRSELFLDPLRAAPLRRSPRIQRRRLAKRRAPALTACANRLRARRPECGRSGYATPDNDLKARMVLRRGKAASPSSGYRHHRNGTLRPV
jgi:hypothetical protein